MTNFSRSIHDTNFPLTSGAQNYLDMAPEHSLPRIVKMAHKAYAEKGDERSLQEFTNDMAKFWLMVKEEFCRIVQAHYFTPVLTFQVNANEAFFFFTERGSFLAGTAPDQNNQRQFVYQKIQLLGQQNHRYVPQGKPRTQDSVTYPQGHKRHGECIAADMNNFMSEAVRPNQVNLCPEPTGRGIDPQFGAGELHAKRYPQGLVNRSIILTDCTMCAYVENFIETSSIIHAFVGKADFDKIKLLTQLIRATILDAAYFTKTA